jgi:hypothetical protein
MTRHLFFAITLIGTDCSTHRQKQRQCNVRTEPQIAWADVSTPLVGSIIINACATATSR